MDEVYISLLVVSVGMVKHWRGGGIFSCIIGGGSDEARGGTRELGGGGMWTLRWRW